MPLLETAYNFNLMKILIKPLILILVNTILLAQVGTSRTNKTLKVAYAGVQVENVDPCVEKEINKIMAVIFMEIKPSQFITAKEAKRLGPPPSGFFIYRYNGCQFSTGS